jgi:hypothetical protein
VIREMVARSSILYGARWALDRQVQFRFDYRYIDIELAEYGIECGDMWIGNVSDVNLVKSIKY